MAPFLVILAHKSEQYFILVDTAIEIILYVFHLRGRGLRFFTCGYVAGWGKPVC